MVSAISSLAGVLRQAFFAINQENLQNNPGMVPYLDTDGLWRGAAISPWCNPGSRNTNLERHRNLAIIGVDIIASFLNNCTNFAMGPERAKKIGYWINIGSMDGDIDRFYAEWW